MKDQPLRGLYAAVLTPIGADGSLDVQRLSIHCSSLLENGCHGVSLFGTTGEGPAFTVEERMAGLEAVLAAGIAPEKILPATGCSALPDTVRLTKHALSNGCSNALIMPPFFFKNLSDDNVYAFFAKLIEDVASVDLGVYLYNFPAVTGVPISTKVINRLVTQHPKSIAGVKDSSGDWGYVTEIRERFPHLSLFTGWEALLPKLLAAGGAGNISGIANIAPQILRDLYDRKPQDENDKVLKGVERLVEIITSLPITPALKAIAAIQGDVPAWRDLRVPYQHLSTEQEAQLFADYTEAKRIAGFE